jgi:hypothetical protein
MGIFGIRAYLDGRCVGIRIREGSGLTLKGLKEFPSTFDLGAAAV